MKREELEKILKDMDMDGILEASDGFEYNTETRVSTKVILVTHRKTGVWHAILEGNSESEAIKLLVDWLGRIEM